MADVARLVGVDISTVSRALNVDTAPLLRAETVSRIEAAAAELGYQPNVLARGLRTQRSRTIGALLPDLANPLFPPIVRGLQDVFDGANYVLNLVNTDNDPERARRAIESLVGRQVEGLLLATARFDDELPRSPETRELPVVLINRLSATEDVPAVVPDDDHGVAVVVEHLFALGHRRIAHVAGPGETSTGKARALAFERLTSGADAFDPRLVVRSSAFVADAGYDACKELLARSDEPFTAVFAANDLIAIGCLRALRESGFVVPDDVSLVGYNDMPFMDLIQPPMTTVRVPMYDMGVEAARLMLVQLDGNRSRRERQVIHLPTELVIRETTSRPPPRA